MAVMPSPRNRDSAARNIASSKIFSVGARALGSQEIGNPEYGCDLAPIDFVSVAKACGADGYRCQRVEEIRPAIEAALNSQNVAVVEAVVDANEKPAKPDELEA
jgi:thiamine pyrophosphate-dependent acetolactate synthase large subunit-like protein